MGSRGITAGYSLLFRFFPAGIFRSRNSIIVNKFGARMMSTISPCLMLPLPPASEGGNNNNTVLKLYSLADSKLSILNNLRLPDDDDAVKFVGSSHGWLALFNKRSNDLFLSNPISGRRVNLPPVEGGSVSKVIISCCPDEEECRAMISFGPENRLAFCWPGHSTRWAPIGSPYGHCVDGKFPRPYEDFIYCKRRKLFFCTTKTTELECWDLRDPRSPRMHWDGLFPELWAQVYRGPEISSTKYLVCAEEQLFLVLRHIMTRMGPDGSYVEETYFGRNRGWDKGYPYKTIGFDAYKIEPQEEEPREEEIKLRHAEGSLDGLAMFIGINQSFAIGAAGVPELKLKPDCIYFTDDKEFTPLKWVARMYNYGGHDVGIFDYGSKSLSPCYYSCDYQSIEMAIPAPLWFTPT